MKYKVKFGFTTAKKGSIFTARTGEVEVDTGQSIEQMNQSKELENWLILKMQEATKKPVLMLSVTSITQLS